MVHRKGIPRVFLRWSIPRGVPKVVYTQVVYTQVGYTRVVYTQVAISGWSICLLVCTRVYHPVYMPPYHPGYTSLPTMLGDTAATVDGRSSLTALMRAVVERTVTDTPLTVTRFTVGR